MWCVEAEGQGSWVYIASRGRRGGSELPRARAIETIDLVTTLAIGWHAQGFTLTLSTVTPIYQLSLGAVGNQLSVVAH